jgi:uncharacterized repeat protein (TIGR03803 family)
MKPVWIALWGASALMTSFSASAANPGVVFTNLYSFVSNGTNAHSPSSALLQAVDGNFYGTTHGGMGGGWISAEMANKGIVFKITPSGVLTTLVSFNGTNGANLVENFGTAALVEDRDGDLYGTTSNGGVNGGGTVFKITTNGVLTTLHSFGGNLGTNGWGPVAGLVEGSDGWFYGTAYNGGIRIRSDNVGMGTVYRVSGNGAWKTLSCFSGTNGEFPASPLLAGRDGNLYGTTSHGGPAYANGPPENGRGTVFKITTNGVLRTLVSFNGSNGALPYAGLVEGINGSLYGTTMLGGITEKDKRDDVWMAQRTFGTIFRITPDGVFTSLFSFNGTNGARPRGALVQGTDGYLYGTTEYGGDDYKRPGAGIEHLFYQTYGTVFRVSTNGAFTSLFSFHGTNGAHPKAGLLQGKDGAFYGTTSSGGAGGSGTIFRMRITSESGGK